MGLTEARLRERDRDSAPTANSVNLVPFRPHSQPAGFLWKRGEHFKVRGIHCGGGGRCVVGLGCVRGWGVVEGIGSKWNAWVSFLSVMAWLSPRCVCARCVPGAALFPWVQKWNRRFYRIRDDSLQHFMNQPTGAESPRGELALSGVSARAPQYLHTVAQPAHAQLRPHPASCTLHAARVCRGCFYPSRAVAVMVTGVPSLPAPPPPSLCH